MDAPLWLAAVAVLGVVALVVAALRGAWWLWLSGYALLLFALILVLTGVG